MLACWLCFEGLLRPGELCQLRVADIDLPMGGWEATENVGMILTIRKPKTRRIYHTQFVLIKNVSLIRWMSWWMQGLDPGRRVFRMGRRLWANMLSLGLSCIGAADKGFTLGSLRGGGATITFEYTRIWDGYNITDAGPGPRLCAFISMRRWLHK